MMPRTFIVTGLPRSRTAWCANWLTTDQSLCYHDERFDESLLVNPRRVGFSGPELIEQSDDILLDYVNAPWLVLLRNSDDARSAFQVHVKSIPGAWDVTGDAATDNLFELRAHKLAVISKHCTVKAIEWTELDNEQTAREVWTHLLPGIAFDVARWRLLCKFNVQQKKIKAWPPPEHVHA